MKIVTEKKVAKIIEQLKNEGKTVTFVSGCFDVIHKGHIDFFRSAAAAGDYVVVALENDTNIKNNKGENRPLFNYEMRSDVLSELQSIDYIFKIEDVVHFNTKQADAFLFNLLSRVKPSQLYTDKSGDSNWKKKKETCKALNLTFIVGDQKKTSSTTNILNHFYSYFN